MSAKVIAVCNQKGGVGKTTTALNMGVGLSRMGKKVLLMDCDFQGNLTAGLGYKRPNELKINLSTLMLQEMRAGLQKEELAAAILPTSEGVDLIPSTIELAQTEFALFNAMNRENILKGIVEHYKPDYDYVVLDCNPHLGLLPINAMTAADSVLIPVAAEPYALLGMTQLLSSIEMVQSHTNGSLKIEGMLLTLVDRRTNICKDVAQAIRRAYGSKIKVFSTDIPVATKLKESSAKGQSIFSYCSNSPAAEAYMNLAKEIDDGQSRRPVKRYEHPTLR